MFFDFEKDFSEFIGNNYNFVDFLQESTQAGIWFWNRTTNEIHFSERWKSILGYRQEDIQDSMESFWNLTHPMDRSSVELALHNYLTNQATSYNIEFRMYHKNGTYRWINSRGATIRKDSIPVEWMVGIHIDTTEKKESQINLTNAKNLLERTGEMAKIGVFEGDLENERFYWSRVVRKIHEVDEDFEPNIENSLSFYRDQDSLKKLKIAFNQLLENKKPYDETLLLTTAKNNRKWVRIIGHGEFENDKCIKVSGTFQDITDQKEKENLQIAGLGGDFGLWEWDLANDQILYSDNWYEQLGYDPNDFKSISSEKWLSLVDEEDSPKVKEAIKQYLNGDSDYYQAEFRLRKKDGECICLLERGKIVSRDIEGKPKILFGIFQNISKFVKISQEMEKVAKLKADFLANMSHEIRTPLNGVLGLERVLCFLFPSIRNTSPSPGDPILPILSKIIK